jgi:quercetin 2,3-dioxygenase
MTTRTLAQVTDSTNEMVGPFKIKNVLPTRTLKQVDPFLLIHHATPATIKGDVGRIPPHPHAGFEVVTYLLDGEFFHRDSKGHDQVARGGDINWMTSGSGIVHSEGATDAFKEKGGTVELLQIWINLPADKKQLPASFRHYSGNDLPVIEKDNTRIKVLIGDYNGSTSPVSTHTPMFAYHVSLKAGTLFTMPVDSSYSSAIYILSGKLNVLSEKVKAGQLVDFMLNGDQLAFTAVEDAVLLVFGGLPIKEKVVSYGPFVMNSLEQVQEAIANYENGKMGVLDY